jgi:hypothetical protein
MGAGIITEAAVGERRRWCTQAGDWGGRRNIFEGEIMLIWEIG